MNDDLPYSSQVVAQTAKFNYLKDGTRLRYDDLSYELCVTLQDRSFLFVSLFVERNTAAVEWRLENLALDYERHGDVPFGLNGVLEVDAALLMQTVQTLVSTVRLLRQADVRSEKKSEEIEDVPTDEYLESVIQYAVDQQLWDGEVPLFYNDMMRSAVYQPRASRYMTFSLETYEGVVSFYWTYEDENRKKVNRMLTFRSTGNVELDAKQCVAHAKSLFDRLVK